jgi:hypothetical protein
VQCSQKGILTWRPSFLEAASVKWQFCDVTVPSEQFVSKCFTIMKQAYV